METNDLYKYFLKDNWVSLSLDNKKNLLQGLENQLASSRGTLPRTIEMVDMRDTTYGLQSGNRIVFNENVIRDGVFIVNYDENFNMDKNGSIVRTYGVSADNWKALETLFHEDTHGVQEDEDRIQSWPSYVSPEGKEDYVYYRMNPCEREAFDAGHNKTIAVINELKAEGYSDSEMDDYVEEIEEENERLSQNLEFEKIKTNEPQLVEKFDQWVAERENGIYNHSQNNDITSELDLKVDNQFMKNIENSNDFVKDYITNVKEDWDKGIMTDTDQYYTYAYYVIDRYPEFVEKIENDFKQNEENSQTAEEIDSEELSDSVDYVDHDVENLEADNAEHSSQELDDANEYDLDLDSDLSHEDGPGIRNRADNDEEATVDDTNGEGISSAEEGGEEATVDNTSSESTTSVESNSGGTTADNASSESTTSVESNSGGTTVDNTSSESTTSVESSSGGTTTDSTSSAESDSEETMGMGM